LLSTAFGVLVFLTLLGFASKTILNRWTTSAVMGTAERAVTRLATSGLGDAALQAAGSGELERARQSLGRYGTRVRFEAEVDPDAVRIHVIGPDLDRWVVARRELPAAPGD
jgi:hypothetical protein